MRTHAHTMKPLSENERLLVFFLSFFSLNVARAGAVEVSGDGRA